MRMHQAGLPQFDINKFQSNLDSYALEYNLYASSIQKYDRDRKSHSINVNYSNELFNARLFRTHISEASISKKRVYLVVPSLFNSSSILDFSDENSLIEELRGKGDVYLLNWREVSSQQLIGSYIDAVAEFLCWLHNFSEGVNITLVGHCIGGNIALCAAKKIVHKIKSIILLTTPWDFSHLKNKMQSALNSGVFDPARNLDIVPSLYVRTLFFLLFPEQFNYKLEKYFAADDDTKLQIMKIEYWLHSGISLPRSLFFQIVEDIVVSNKFIHILSEDRALENITCPVINIHAEKDRLAPVGSSTPIVSRLPKTENILLKGGHIGYLTTTNSFNNDYLSVL